MSQKIGPREQALRDMREKAPKRSGFAKIVDDTLAKLPKTSGKKPVKRKKGRTK